MGKAFYDSKVIIGARRAPHASDTWIWASDGTKVFENGDVKIEKEPFEQSDGYCFSLIIVDTPYLMKHLPCEEVQVLCETRYVSAESTYMEQDRFP